MSETSTICAVLAGGAASAIVDLRTRRVPNALTFGIGALGVALAAMRLTGVSVPGALGGFAVGLALMLPGHVIGATGAGDVKLFAALGTLLGPGRTGMAFVYTALAGGLIAVVIAARRRRLRATVKRTAMLLTTAGGNVAEIEDATENNRFAYAPAIAAGALAAALGL
jgi:prepilin peptidase CpaA